MAASKNKNNYPIISLGLMVDTITLALGRLMQKDLKSEVRSVWKSKPPLKNKQTNQPNKNRIRAQKFNINMKIPNLLPNLKFLQSMKQDPIVSFLQTQDLILGFAFHSAAPSLTSSHAAPDLLQQPPEQLVASAQAELARAYPGLFPSSFSNALAGIQFLVLNPFHFTYSDP